MTGEEDLREPAKHENRSAATIALMMLSCGLLLSVLAPGAFAGLEKLPKWFFAALWATSSAVLLATRR